MTSKPPTSQSRAVAETVAAGLIIAARLLIYPPPVLWRDWVLVLAAYWIYTAWGSKSRAWPHVTLWVVVILLGFWGQGQIRSVFELWGVIE